MVRFTKNLTFDIDQDENDTLIAANAAKDRTVFVVHAPSFGDFLQRCDMADGWAQGVRHFIR